MTSIARLLADGRTRSLEFFPPRTPEGSAQFAAALDEIVDLAPSFASVTYGALGSTRDTTRDMVVGMNADLGFPTMAHLTCVGHSRREVVALLDEYARGGVENILALGGDPPGDGSPATGDFVHAIELVEIIREHPAGFVVGVAAHPELHPRSRDRAADRRHLAAKLTRADFAITQFFFRVEDYERMLEELGDLGCDRPVLPGVMPFTSAEGLRRMAGVNGTVIPGAVADRLSRVEGEPEGVRALGVEVATDLCRRLQERGAPGVHLYTLNRSASVREVWRNLGG